MGTTRANRPTPPRPGSRGNPAARSHAVAGTPSAVSRGGPATRGALHRALQEMLETRRVGFQKELGRVAGEWTADSIHDLRVACRRYRSALRGFAPFLDEAATKALGAELKAFMQAFNDLRDLDVQLEMLAQIPAPARPSVRTSLDEVTAWFTARKGRLDAELQQFVRDHAAVGTRPLPDPRPGPLPTVPEGVRTVLRAELEEAVRRSRAIAWDMPQETVVPLHGLRIQFKRLRYAVELFAPFLGKEAPGLLKVCKNVQDLLGWIHDLDLLAETLRKVWRRQTRDRQRLVRALVAELPWPFPRGLDPEARFLPAPRDHRKAFLHVLADLSAQRERHYQAARSLLGNLESLHWSESLARWFVEGSCPPIWKKEFARHAV